MARNTIGLFLFVAIGAVLLPSVDRLQSADPPAAKRDFFKGKWKGKYGPEKMPLYGEYIFHAEADGGKLTVEVSLEKEKMTLKGKRLGHDAMRLQGTHKDSVSGKVTTYWYMGKMGDRSLVLQWLAVEKDSQKTATGVSTLTR